MKLIPRLRFGIMGDISIVFFEWMVFQLFVLPFLLFSFVPAVYVFANDDQCDLFKPFHIRKAVHLQERSEEHTSELQSRGHLVCRLLLEKKTNSTPCIRKDIISSKSLMRLSICLWKPSIGIL